MPIDRRAFTKKIKELMSQGDTASLQYMPPSRNSTTYIQYRPKEYDSKDWAKEKCHFEFEIQGEKDSVTSCDVAFHVEKKFESKRSLGQLIGNSEKFNGLKRTSRHNTENACITYKNIEVGDADPDVKAKEAVDAMIEFYQKYGDEIIRLIEQSKNSKEQINYITLLLKNHNIILHGAPGTGKTYLAKKIAKEMIFGDAEKTLTPEEQEQFNERCGFVQFHQSYDYTDFVEGLRPVNQAQGKIGFVLKDGVFKAFCKKALKTMVGENPSFDGAKDNQYWREKCIEFLDRNCSVDKKRFFSVSGGEFYIIERNEDSIQIEIPKNPQTSHLSIKINDLIEVVKHQDLKYVKDVRKILNRPEKENGEIYHTQGDSYLYAIAQKINESIAEKNIYFVFIIDEINRGEMSKIFGELFFSIDPGYRGEKGKIKTQYQNLIDAKDPFADGFFIPKNVYIIGTMNDIDRSVESMDFAMRRRFAFKEIQAKDRIEMLDEIKDEKRRKLAITKVKALNTAIEKTEGLSSAYHIGPAYFLKLNKYDGDFDKLWKFHIEGVVHEYLRGMDDAKGKQEKIEIAYKEAKAE